MNYGFWKCESKFTRARFIRQKCYIEEIEGQIKITCAGLPSKCYDSVTWENFRTGFKCSGKLTYKHVKRWRNVSSYGVYHKRRKRKVSYFKI